MRVKVARFTQNNPADPIIEPLLTTQDAMIERGRNELDEQQFSRNIYTLKIPYNDDIVPGEIIEIIDTAINQSWRGKVLSVNISVGNPGISQTVKLDRIV